MILSYDPKKLKSRMLHMAYNFNTLALAAGVHPATAQSFILTGKAQAKTVAAICKALRFKSPAQAMREER